MATSMRDMQACLFVLWMWVRVGDGYNTGFSCPYGQNCFEPAPPGRVPKCAQPGYTYCVDTDPYPDRVIRELIIGGRYDIGTLLSDESDDDFANTVRRPAPHYGPPGYPYPNGPKSLANVDQISLVEEPIDIPKPNYRYQNTLNNQAFFDQAFQKSSLHPPSALEHYNPANLPTFRLANFSTLGSFRGLHTGASNILGQSTAPRAQVLNYETHYNKRFSQGVRQNSYNPVTPDYYNIPSIQFYNNNLSPAYDQPAGAWVRQTAAGSTPFNSVEWWRYMNPNSRSSDVTIESSIALPSTSTVYYPLNGTSHTLQRRRRSAAAADMRNMSGAEALQFVFQQARSEVEAEKSRKKRQAPGNIVQLCQSRSQYVTPRAALNNQGNWRYVVNMANNNMTQLVRAEICTSTECNGICTIPLGYTSRCEQKFVQKRLVALQSNGQNLYTDVFWIPSCCQCIIISNSDNN